MRLGRRTKRILSTLAALAILFVLAHSGPAKHAARRTIVSAIERLVEGQASVEALDYRLWRGELELEGLAVAPETGTYKLTARLLRLNVTGLPAVSLDVTEPELTINRLAEGSATDSAPLALLRYLHGLRIERGAIELLDAVGFEDVDAELLESSEGHRLALHAPRGGLRLMDDSLELGPLDADAVLTSTAVRMESLSLLLLPGASFARAEGELNLAGPFGADLHFDTALDASLAPLVNDGLELRGVVAASGRAVFEDGSHHIEAEVRSEQLSLREVPFRDVSGRADLEGHELRIRELEADAFEGRFSLEADLALSAEGDRVVDLHWEGVDPAELTLALTGERLPLSTVTAGSIHLDLGNLNANEVTGTADLRLAPVASTELPSATGAITASLDSGIITVSRSTLTVSNPELREAGVTLA